jgi:hypothetical protein
MENVIQTVEETLSVPHITETVQVNNVEEPVEKKEELALEAGNVSDANTAEKQENKQEEVVAHVEEKTEVVEGNKTPAKELQTPAKKEKKTTEKKEKAASTSKKTQNKQNKSTAKKEKVAKSHEEKEKPSQENKNGNKGTVKRSKSVVTKTEVKSALKKSVSAEITFTKKDRKVDLEEFSKYESLLNKKTSRKSKKE